MQIYKVCNSRVSILESPHFYRFLPNRNVDQFIFIFFKERFFTHFFSLEACAVYVRKLSQIFKIFSLCGQRCRLKDVKHNALDISDFRNRVLHRMFLGSRWQIHLDRHKVIIYINFGSSQPPFSLKEQLLLP